MTTVNTIEDLIRILDEHPEWNEALRSRMLSRDLTRFTGQTAHAVVAAQRIRPGIERLIERGEVHWAQILLKELETE